MPDADTTTAHLWEVDHPYYCQEGNWFSSGQHTLFASWAEFTDTAFHGADRDQNLLIRWDWNSPTRHPDPDLRGDDPDELLLFFVLQRKAWLCSVGIAVTDEDEPAVRTWLQECAATVAALWDPLPLGPHTAPAPPAA
ncbi:hypothetical protein ABZX65_27020 [Streptomyces sp. NPDC003300]|uniref:hypothetical protein n=1 Tax=unclassified Streptomyces TaxID=2593676 RepID=UPI0033AC47BA